MKDILDASGTTVDVSSNKALAAWLEAACAAAPQAASLIKALTVRAMSEAQYCSTGQLLTPVSPESATETQAAFLIEAMCEAHC